MNAQLSAELERGISLQAEGKNQHALKVFERVIGRGTQDCGADSVTLIESAWQGKCQVLVREKRWFETSEACTEFLTQYGEKLDFHSRWTIADIRRMRCLAAAEMSVAATGERGVFAHTELDSLIAWLRVQPELNFSPELAWQLLEKVRWCADDEQGLDALDEIVRLLARLGDGALTQSIAAGLGHEMPVLFALEESDRDRATQALQESELAVDQVGTALSNHELNRMTRLARSLNRLAELLGPASLVDSDAAELRAFMLLHVVVALERLGRIDASEQVLEQVASLDQAALAASDRLTRDALQNGAEGDGDGGPNLVVAAIFKAKIHAANGRPRGAVLALDEVLARFSGVDVPWLSAILEGAFELRQRFSAEPAPMPPATAHSVSESKTRSERVVWRLGR